MGFLRTVWAAWKVVAHKLGDFQGRLALSLFYYVVLGPFAVGVKLLSDPLRLDPAAPGGWLPCPAAADADSEPLTVARRQF